MTVANTFNIHDLGSGHQLLTGELPTHLRPSRSAFHDTWWRLHPDDYHTINTPGGPKKTPRFQQAYGTDYHYSGNTNTALPIPPLMVPLITWCQTTIDSRLNGVLRNWYEGALGHYIGKHRDSTRNMIPGSPIVTVLLGEERIFGLRPWQGKGKQDFEAKDGTVFIMPYDTNLAFTHEVPRLARFKHHRISVTLRAFAS